MNRDLAPLTIAPQASVRDALAAIDAGGCGVALLVADDLLRGLVSDGDVRRALLAGAALTDAVVAIATANPVVARPDVPRAGVLDLMRARRLSAVPIVDDGGRLRGLHLLSDVVGARELPNHAVIMAGGRGTRLGPLTRATPKPLLEVAGRPIVEWAILDLVGSGIRIVHVSVGHLAEQVIERLGDGSSLGCTIDYLREEHPLGTAGSLALLPDPITETLVVMNGDVMTRLAAADLIRAHDASGAAITVATRPYLHEIPYGVVEADAGNVAAIAEKPTVEVEVNAGVYALDPAVLPLVPRGVASTMPDLVQRCLDDGRPVRTWAIRDDWIDVGTPADLNRARRGE